MTTGQESNTESDSLLFLHLSDIHFQEPFCLNPDTDQDRPVRQALLNDIEAMVKKLGPVDAILVSGDIAFKGDLQEYEAAKDWLVQVACKADCPHTEIHSVPGNHDIIRVLAGDPGVQDVRRKINKHSLGATRDDEFYKILHQESGLKLLKPLTEYNKFAASFRCAVIPKQPFWIHNLALAPGWVVKMHGLTTTILSGPENDKKGQLYLGPLQYVFAPSDGIIHLAILHHPPDWLEDGDQLDEALWNYCAVQLVGHKHRTRYHPGTNGVRLAAGAVNPSRKEAGWEPGYNFIKIRMIADGSKHSLRIESHIRIWQNNPDRFIAKQTEDDEEVFVHMVVIRRKPASALANNVKEQLPMIAETNGTDTSGNMGDAPVPHYSEGELTFDFWQLKPSQRRRITQSLELTEPEDDKLPEAQRYILAFERAEQRGMFQELKELVDLALSK